MTGFSMELHWQTPPQRLAGNVRRLTSITRARLQSVLAEQAAVAEGDAKVTAPWTDRTGAARNSLYATSMATGNGGVLEVGHGVDYGIWLEVANAGRYAAVIPTLQRTYPRVIQALGRLW